MKTPFLPGLLRSLLTLTLVASAISPLKAGQKVLRFTATVSNTLGNAIILDDPALNGKPNQRAILTQYFSGIYNDHPVGFFYDYLVKKWKIVNEDGVSIPLGANFNVLLPKHTVPVNATPFNSTGDYTFFPLQKGKHDAILFFSHVTNPVKALNPVHIYSHQGIWFTDPPTPPAKSGIGTSSWAIFNEDQSSAIAATYTVADLTKVPDTFVLTANAINTVGNTTTIDNAAANNNADAVLFVTHIYNPLGATANYLDKELGVFYDGTHWRIFTQDASAIPDGTTFNVAVFPAVTP